MSNGLPQRSSPTPTTSINIYNVNVSVQGDKFFIPDKSSSQFVNTLYSKYRFIPTRDYATCRANNSNKIQIPINRKTTRPYKIVRHCHHFRFLKKHRRRVLLGQHATQDRLIFQERIFIPVTVDCIWKEV